jgi:hypothetical protein
MKKLLFTGLLFIAANSFAQLPGNFNLLYNLRTDKDSIMQNLALRESLADMVSVNLTDSILRPKVATHQTRLFNWALRSLAGLRWLAVDGKKHKLVGTMNGGFSSPSKPFFTEYDITFNLFSHLPQYQALVKKGYQAQYAKMLKGRNYLIKKGINPDSLTNDELSTMRVHPENTPRKNQRDSLNKYFYPCMPGTNIENHPAWGQRGATVGVYGAYVLDGNHKGGPEIHPYEWLWWMDTKQTDPFTTRWYAGLLREGSNRFLRWSKKPRTGTISIPFVFNNGNLNNTIVVEHLVKGKFSPKGFKKLAATVPTGAKTFDKPERITYVNGYTGKEYFLDVTFKSLDTDAVKWWVTLEGEKGVMFWGYIHIAVSVEDGYAFSVTTLD